MKKRTSNPEVGTTTKETSQQGENPPKRDMTFTASVAPSYRKLSSIYAGLDPVKKGKVDTGSLNVRYKAYYDRESKSWEYESCDCGYSLRNGLISGLARFYRFENGRLGEKYDLKLKVISEQEVEIVNLPDELYATTPEDVEKAELREARGIFEKQNLKHLHIDPFRKENLKYWTPRSEADVYLVFGVVEKYTGYKYCCGANNELLELLGYRSSNDVKPDAILIDQGVRQKTGEYVIAEFKMNSSSFTLNHKKEDVDVLVVWQDDYNGTEAEREKDLPSKVIVLSEIVRGALKEELELEEQNTV